MSSGCQNGGAEAGREVDEDRTQLRSSIVVSQLAVEKLHATTSDPTLAEEVLDRLRPASLHRREAARPCAGVCQTWSNPPLWAAAATALNDCASSG